MQPFKTTAFQAPKRAPASFSLLAAFLLAGSVTFGACGDDGNLLGSDVGGGSAGQAGTGTTSMAGNGHAGARTTGGGTSGGTTNAAAGTGGTGSSSAGAGSGGTSSSAGAPSCNIGECLRANVCLDKCGGKVVYTGCCSCAANTVEQTRCMGAGGQGSGGQSSGDCAGSTCTAGQSCVAHRTVGGAIFPVDTQGMCMAGKHAEGDRCQPDFNYACAELTGCNAPSASCRCAPNTDCAYTTTCRLPTSSAWLDPAADLVCELQAP
jgi:hypothetical protein